ncbi:MAG: SUMF1/EgtB/PvdO family nonheme iron enzyme [Deltaproteobacteria bacterium]|nr:SUMF1/EgtB/PvdO family nonheme iron enzyme [Deltaproteobacteria bacterium]
MDRRSSGSAPLALLAGLVAIALSVPTPSRASTRCQDKDGDGYGLDCPAGDDCNDKDESIHPGAKELCNQRDDDCNALVDDSAADCPAPRLDPKPISIPAGLFVMGSDEGAADERPVHKVDVSAVRLDRYEVTNARYRECVKSGGCTAPALPTSHRRPHYFDSSAFDDYPVILVSWHQAEQFCRFAGGHLPTEAEWEKAARGAAPETRRYPWGDQEPDCRLANLGGSASCVGDTDRVGRRPAGASPFGAFDMAGNVWEWVGDWYAADYYRTSPARDPRGPEKGSLKVMRGGCWESGASSLRVSCRKAELPAAWADNVGVRCAYPAASGGAR